MIIEFNPSTNQSISKSVLLTTKSTEDSLSTTEFFIYGLATYVLLLDTYY